MCYAGAKSETAQQLKELLHLQKLTDEDILKMNSELVTCINTRLGKDVALNTANKLYPNNGFALEKSFIETVTKNFHGDVEQVDFSNAAASSKTINDWVLSKTNNKIEFNDSFLKSLNFNSYSRKDEEKEFELVDWTICGNDGDDYDEDIKELETKFNPNNDTNDKSIEIKVSFFE